MRKRKVSQKKKEEGYKVFRRFMHDMCLELPIDIAGCDDEVEKVEQIR